MDSIGQHIYEPIYFSYLGCVYLQLRIYEAREGALGCQLM